MRVEPLNRELICNGNGTEWSPIRSVKYLQRRFKHFKTTAPPTDN